MENIKKSLEVLAKVANHRAAKDDVIDIWCEETSSPKMIKKY